MPPHKLIMDVTTWWNSTLDMLVHYLEQQAAVAAALTGPKHWYTRHLRHREYRRPCEASKSFKDSYHSLVWREDPHMIEQSMAPNVRDFPTVADVKRAILSNISGRYSGDAYNYLLESTALDPRFQTLPQLDHNQCENVLQRIQKRMQQFTSGIIHLNCFFFLCVREMVSSVKIYITKFVCNRNMTASECVCAKRESCFAAN